MTITHTPELRPSRIELEQLGGRGVKLFHQIGLGLHPLRRQHHQLDPAVVRDGPALGEPEAPEGSRSDHYRLVERYSGSWDRSL
jgi:hypothetical protein